MLTIAHRRFIRRAVRTNLITVFNLDMIAIAALMFLLGSPASGIGTAVVLIANVVLRVGQEVRVKSRLDRLISTIRPRATVIRDGEPRRVGVPEVVEGDLLAVGLGDEVPVSGVIVRASGLAVGGSTTPVAVPKLGAVVGDRLEAGRFCTGGHAIYRATEAGARREAGRIGETELLTPALTPLTILVRRILYALLAVVAAFSLLLVTGGLIPRGSPGSQAAYRNAFSLVFGVAPTSLFFLLVLGYLIGLQDVALRGGLVYRQTTIEALARVTRVCLGVGSVISGAQVSIQAPSSGAIKGKGGGEMARRLLGDFVHSVSTDTTTNQLLAAALAGSRRVPLEVAGHLSVYGWQGASFDDPDMEGTYVIGVPQVIATAVPVEGAISTRAAALASESKAMAERGATRVRRWLTQFRPGARGRTGAQDQAGLTEPDTLTRAGSGESPTPLSRATTTGLLARVRARVRDAMSPRDQDPAGDIQPAGARPRRLLFAQRAAIGSLLDGDGAPVLPDRLVPLAEIVFSNTARPDAVRATQALQRAGIEVQLLGGSDTASVAGLARSLGIDETVDLSGQTEVQRAASLQALTRRPGVTAEVMQGASALGPTHPGVAIARRDASQAALAAADMVLVEDSLAGLPRTLSAARRVTNGVMAMLKLNLSHIGTQLGLLVIVFAVGYHGFAYSSVQSGAITVFSISIPSVVLLRLAPSRLGSSRSAALSLARFVLPSALASIALVVFVYWGFLVTDGSAATAQVAVTWVLVGAGLLRVMLVLPPSRIWSGGERLVGDARVFGLTTIAAGLFVAAVAIPLTRGWLGLAWLPSAASYAVLAAALLVWTAVQLTFWRWF